jgi:catechol 2,3-dioxygenase
LAELSAQLDHLQLLTNAPERLVAFYGEALGMRPERLGQDLWLCAAAERRMLIGRGPSPALRFGAYRFESRSELAAMRERLERHGIVVAASPSPLFGPPAFSLTDPDGNTMVFGHEPSLHSAPETRKGRRARLQHVAVASDNPERLLRFYTDVLGFVLSDKVLDDGALSACWLRTDREHHTMALFRTRQAGRRLDHYSYEVEDWGLIRDWADDFAARGIELAWGPGRHGPGNNLFIMIRDPDDNLIEFSAELEVITNDRPVVVWPQEEKTFNKWGPASLRS